MTKSCTSDVFPFYTHAFNVICYACRTIYLINEKNKQRQEQRVLVSVMDTDMYHTET